MGPAPTGDAIAPDAQGAADDGLHLRIAELIDESVGLSQPSADWSAAVALELAQQLLPRKQAVGARNPVVAGQAACLYSLMRPSQRVVRTSRRGSGWSVVLLSRVVCLWVVSGGREPPLYLVERLWRGSVGAGCSPRRVGLYPPVT